MRLMSFALTTPQVRRREKTVTRRIGWRFAKVGDIVQPVEKGQGLKKGERMRRVGGPIRFVGVRRERLSAITQEDVVREGFPDFAPADFLAMFCEHNTVPIWTEVTRIEFEYLEVLNDDAIHNWFELSYAQYLTIPRSVLQSMPPEWQRRFVSCLEALDETIDWRPKSGQQYRVTLHGPDDDARDDDDAEAYCGPDLTDPFMDYARGRRRIPHRTETT